MKKKIDLHIELRRNKDSEKSAQPQYWRIKSLMW